MRRLAMLSILLVACSTVQEFETQRDEHAPPATAPGTSVMPPCDPGQCAPIVLAEKQGLAPDRADMQGVWTIVTDDTWVYWMTAFAEIYRLPKDGGERPELLAETQAAPWQMKLAGDYLYFTNVHDGRVERIPKRGGVVEPVTPAVADPGGAEQIMAFAIDESAITWMDTLHVQRCESIPCPLPSGAKQLRAGTEGDRPAALATAGENVFVSLWADGDSPARGIAAANQGGYVATLDVPYWSLLARPAADRFTTIYGASNDVLVRAVFPGSDPATVLASGSDLDGLATSLTLDERFLYWVNSRQGRIMRVREDGSGKPESVIDGQGWLRTLFATSDAIYFGGKEGKVLKMPKPKDRPTR